MREVAGEEFSSRMSMATPRYSMNSLLLGSNFLTTISTTLTSRRGRDARYKMFYT